MPKSDILPTIKQLTPLQIKVDSNKKWGLIENGDKGTGHYLINK